VPLTLWVARWRCRFWAGCITNISEPKFPTRDRSPCRGSRSAISTTNVIKARGLPRSARIVFGFGLADPTLRFLSILPELISL
jgi:hypothetical protein